MRNQCRIPKLGTFPRKYIMEVEPEMQSLTYSIVVEVTELGITAYVGKRRSRYVGARLSAHVLRGELNSHNGFWAPTYGVPAT